MGHCLNPHFLPLQAKGERLHSGLPHLEVLVTFGYGEGSILPCILGFGEEANSSGLALKPLNLLQHIPSRIQTYAKANAASSWCLE